MKVFLSHEELRPSLLRIKEPGSIQEQQINIGSTLYRLETSAVSLVASYHARRLIT
ncbi:hypothetical protein RHGRI_023039 [Rhododendron griersonianum]|uniref:Uncharacterized protein n=1 Tax=Rhododendron griersonianum TaxID=479676 RepID=A0AAV6J673_9ERIC|nr:hypothetical protein RHGRI_023039 [Rhododendron griersonianum]